MTTWAYDIAEALLVDALPRRWAHVQGVAARARLLAPILGPDADLLECAAVLHDIGYAAELATTGLHALDGARYLRDHTDAGDRIACLVAHHSVAWREAEARELRSELEAEFPREDGALTDALCFCDMTTTPDGEPTNPIDRVTEITGRYGPDSLVGRFIREAEPDILASAGRVLARLADAKTGAAQPM